MSCARPETPEKKRAMQVVNHVRELIERGSLQPGDKLPPERELARGLKMSRTSLRTGIGYLAAMGVIRIRHGVGIFVADGPPDFGGASLSFMRALHGFTSSQVFEARILLEGNLAALAAERGKHAQFAALTNEVAEMFAALDNPAEYLIHDVLFHRIIAEAAGNPILAAIMETISSSMYDQRRRTVQRATDLRESAEMHRTICRAVRARKPATARRLMEQHLRMAEAAQGLERTRKTQLSTTGKDTTRR